MGVRIYLTSGNATYICICRQVCPQIELCPRPTHFVVAVVYQL